jgi:hypothetical protein
MTAAELVGRCNALGVELGAAGDAIVWEAHFDPPDELLAALKANKAALLALVRGPYRNCVQCGRALDEKRRCWRCCDRVCVECGRQTGSAFIQRCITCGLRCPDERAAEQSAQRPLAIDTPVVSPADLPPDFYERWQERAGIRELDGGLPRPQAAALALADVLGTTNPLAGDAEASAAPAPEEATRVDQVSPKLLKE